MFNFHAQGERRRGATMKSWIELNFADVSTDRTEPAMTVIVKKVLSKYRDSLKSKLMIEMYDGASVMSRHIAGVQALVNEEIHLGFCFHCTARRLNLIFCQYASPNSSIKAFIANINALSTFTNLSSKRRFSGLITLKFRAQVKQDGIIALVMLVSLQASMRFWYKSLKEFSTIHCIGMMQPLYKQVDCCITLAFCSAFWCWFSGKILRQSLVLYDVLQYMSMDFSYGVGVITDFTNFLAKRLNLSL